MDGVCLPIPAAGGVFRAAAPEKLSFFNHPVNSVFSGAKNSRVGMIKGVPKDDAVLMERGEVDQGNEDLTWSSSCSSSEPCDVEYGNENENEIEFDEKSFSKMVNKVSLSVAQLYAQMCYLGNLAYAIPTIKPGNFKRQCGLRYVTTSIEKREQQLTIGDDLGSISSWPCEWYICDDDESATRFFVIQGSETLASWQANLLIQPVQFEGTGFYVHRGIYEAAKGMYQHMLPEIQAHTKNHGTQAKLRFTGHSLGGSLSLLINLMLLVRGEVPLSSLLPVITFGSPTVMCKGDKLLSELGLPRSHVQAITMHRDIVPRVFSCHYPCHVVELLKAVNGNFRNHPCLNKQKLLYAPMGEMIILQPDSSFSPKHDLLPSGSGLYRLRCSSSDANEGEKQLRAAQSVFLNTPHPLEILSDRSAYCNGGTIQRDHDMKSYLKCVRSVLRHELGRVRKEERWKAWWPLVSPRVGLERSGSLKRLGRLVTSHHMHLVVVLIMCPVRMLLMGLHHSGSS